MGINNGQIAANGEHTPDTEVEIKCADNTSSFAEHWKTEIFSIDCQENGTWSPQQTPECVKSKNCVLERFLTFMLKSKITACEAITNDQPPNKTMTVANENKTHNGRLMPGSVVTFACKAGFMVENATTIGMTRVCGVNGDWDDTTQPQCMHWACMFLL